jgi:hypothetical protein
LKALVIGNAGTIEVGGKSALLQVRITYMLSEIINIETIGRCCTGILVGGDFALVLLPPPSDASSVNHEEYSCCHKYTEKENEGQYQYHINYRSQSS